MAADWIQIIGGGFVGAVLAFGSAFYFNIRKEKLDRKNALKQRTVDNHAQRREHLSKVIANISEARWLFADARANANGAKGIDGMDMDNWTVRVKNSQIERGYEAITRAITEAQLYGKIPQQTKLPNLDLALYVEAVCNLQLKKVYWIHNHDEEVKEAIAHTITFLRDLRVLMDIEESLARDVMSEEPSNVIPALPYFAASVLPKYRPEVKALDFTHLEGWDNDPEDKNA